MTLKRSEISLAAEQNVNTHGGITWNPAEQADYLAEKLGGPAKGKAQLAIIQKLRGYAMSGAKGHKFDFNDLVRAPEFRGIHYAKLMKAAEVLAKNGRVAYDGKTITLTEATAPARSASQQTKMQFLSRGSRTGQLTGLTEAEAEAKSAWSHIKPQYRSKHVGWTKSGEFACPYCGVSIGKNLRGDKPFALATQHLKKEHGKTPADMAKLTEAEDAEAAAESSPVSAAVLREDSRPDGGVTGGFNRHQKLMSPDTRELVFKSREQEIEAFAADRGYDPRIVMAIAEVSMRMGRVPDLRQYGVYGEEALAIRHFVAGDILNLAVEDENAQNAPNASILREAVYNIHARPAASAAGTDASNMADQIAKAIAPLLKGRYQTVQAQDVFGQAQSIHIKSGNITPEMISHNVAWHNDPYKFQAIVSGFKKDGSAGPKISVEQLTGHYAAKKMRKKTVAPGKESLMVKHIKNYIAGLMKDAPAPRAEAVEVSVSILRGKGGDAPRAAVHEEVAAARNLPEFTDLLGSKKLDALTESAPPGFSGTVKAMKGEGGTKKKEFKGEPGKPNEPADIDNPWALSWWMYNKGSKPHYKPEKGKPRYKSPEKYAADKKKAEEQEGNQRAATRFAELLGCRLSQTQAPSKYTL